MSGSLKGQTVLVIGRGRGIARAVTPAARDAGAGVVAAGRNQFGDHPQTALIRMRWARGVTREAFANSPPEPGPSADASGLLTIRPRTAASGAVT